MKAPSKEQEITDAAKKTSRFPFRNTFPDMERATRKNSQLAAARSVAMKMAQRLRKRVGVLAYRRMRK